MKIGGETENTTGHIFVPYGLMHVFSRIGTLLGLTAVCVFSLMASYPLWTVPEPPPEFGCGTIAPYRSPAISQANKLPGFEIYINNCTVCHDMTEQVVGPALLEVHHRMDSLTLRAWIRNSQALIESGDEYAVNLYEEYNRTPMPAFNFTDEQLTQLIDYLKAYSEAYVPIVVEARPQPEIAVE